MKREKEEEEDDDDDDDDDDVMMTDFNISLHDGQEAKEPDNNRQLEKNLFFLPLLHFVGLFTLFVLICVPSLCPQGEEESGCIWFLKSSLDSSVSSSVSAFYTGFSSSAFFLFLFLLHLQQEEEKERGIGPFILIINRCDNPKERENSANTNI